MNDSFESDERKRKETIECLYWSLMNGWDIPKEIREYYGFSEDYELYHQLESMEPAEYRLKRLECEVPDIVELDAQLKHTVENIFERLCKELNARLDRLTGRKTAVDDNTKEKEHKSYRKVHIPVSPKPKRRKMGL